jgi:hypothetical protein
MPSSARAARIWNEVINARIPCWKVIIDVSYNDNDIKYITSDVRNDPHLMIYGIPNIANSPK